jgi:hypothetical protein
MKRLVPLILLFAVGCGDPSKENLEKIKTGMTLSEVQNLVGRGRELKKEEIPPEVSNRLVPAGRSMKGSKFRMWGSVDGNYLVVGLENDNVVDYAWSVDESKSSR